MIHRYRAFDKIGGVMVSPERLVKIFTDGPKPHYIGYLPEDNGRNSSYPLIDCWTFELMLSTGMNGENGKEIFHDDIAEVKMLDYYSNETISLEENDTFIGEVVMHNFMWMVRAKDATNIPLADVATSDMIIKVLGNIHNNSKLLEDAHGKIR